MTDKFDKDSYRTPKYIFKWLSELHYYFDIDGCASEHNRLCKHWIGPTQIISGVPVFAEYNLAYDFLGDDVFKKVKELSEANLGYAARIYVNPPYSNPLPFIERAVGLMRAGHLVVMLLPADKSTKWYQVIQRNATEVIDIVGGRINFIHPETGEEVKGNNKGSMVAVFDPFMQGFVTRQVSLSFIKKVGGHDG